jgi:antitoxin component YwqK of YwqJK toxin-antitoxin module
MSIEWEMERANNILAEATMSLSFHSLLRSPRAWAVAVPVIVTSIIAWALGRQWDPFEGYSDQLFVGEILALTDADPVGPAVDKGNETSSPTEIDGEMGKVSRGWYANGSPRYEESWLHDKQHGPELWWNGQGQKTVERHWRAGYRHGKETRWYSNGQMAEDASYDHERLQGTYRTWYRTGQERAKIEYQEDLREGPAVFWHPNETVSCRATFSNDQLEGTWEEWGADGEPIRRKEYRGGALVSETPVRSRKPFAYPGKVGATDFAFVLAQGSGWHGYNTLRVSASGWCECRYFFNSGQEGPSGDRVITQVWRKAEFQLTDETQQQLREALKVADVFGLREKYINERIADGTQWVVRLRADGTEKEISCSNKFPGVLRVLSRTLRDQIMAPHKMEVLTATRYTGGTPSPSKEAWLEIPER